MRRDDSQLVLAHIWVAFASFAIGAVMGAAQMTSRTGLPVPGAGGERYFISVTAHGTVMAYFLPTLFAMGFGYFVAMTALNRPLPSRNAAWVGLAMTLIGFIMAVIPIFEGHATVLYTFYPPLVGSAFYYLGVLLIVAGSWIWAAQMIWAMTAWKREHPGEPVPLVMFGTVATAILWLWTTVGVTLELVFQLIPAALGWKQTIDVGLARTLFSWTLHSIVYFWLLPAYIALYALLPRAAGGRLYSDTMGRLSFILLLLFSLPVGMHHLFMDPEHGAGFKFLQTVLTVLVTVPTLLTVFTISASMEIAGRLRGGRGVFGWIRALPWERPMVLASGLAFVMLGLGGLGGIVNMSYGMNAMIHNTSFVTAHFHLIFGGSVLIMYFAIAYEIWPTLTGNDASRVAPMRLQLWLWFIGIMVLTLPWHALGLLGQPRRVAAFDYSMPGMESWERWTLVSAGGGAIMLIAALIFIWCLGELFSRPRESERPMVYASSVYPVHRLPTALNGFALWNWVLLSLMAIAYGYPIAQFFFMDGHPALIHHVGGGR